MKTEYDPTRCVCGKKKFDTRSAARRFAKKHHISRVHPYFCEDTDTWHLGHMPHDVRFSADPRMDGRRMYGERHIALTSSTIVRSLVNNELSHHGVRNEIGARVIAQIAHIQRTEDRQPTLFEAAVFPDDRWELLRIPDEDWESSQENWERNVKVAVMRELARRKIILIDGHGLDVRINSLWDEKLAA